MGSSTTEKAIGTIVSEKSSEGWTTKRLDAILKIQKGEIITETDIQIGNIPVVAGGVKPAYYHDTANRGGKTITVSASGKNAGYVAIWNEPIFASDCLTISENINYCIEYIYYQLSYRQSEIYDLQTGGAQPHVYAKDISPLLIPVPQLEEQKAIAEILLDVDHYVDALTLLIAKKKVIKLAVMQQLFTGKMRLPGYIKNWETGSLSKYLVYDRPDSYIVKNTEYLDRGDIPVLTANKTFILGYTNEEFGICKNVPAIIFDDFTTATKYIDRPFKVKSAAIKFLYPRDSRINLKYIFNRIQLVHFPVFDHKSHYIQDYQHIKISIPDLVEQNEIQSLLVDLDAEIELLEQRCKKMQDIKLGMMQQLLTGKVRFAASSLASEFSSQ